MKNGEVANYKGYKIRCLRKGYYEILSASGAYLTWRATLRRAKKRIDDIVDKKSRKW